MPGRKALVVGINYYENGSSLQGCVRDAQRVAAVLECNSDGSPNFDVKLLTANGHGDPLYRLPLKKAVEQLFADDAEIALFYFAGHGHVETTGGYLRSSECLTGDAGLSLGDVLKFANASKARNKVILLDSCHSGIAGTSSSAPQSAELSEGLTILTASTAEQEAREDNGGGTFTNLLVDALNGGAANLVGEITPGSVYAHIDQSLGSWHQRPVFKTNVKSFVSLRKVQPPISLPDLRRITEFFPARGSQFQLDPSFEPESTAPNPENTAIFAILQKYNRVNLVVPEGAPHMWHAAMQSKTCRLTMLGEHYRRLVERKRI